MAWELQLPPPRNELLAEAFGPPRLGRCCCWCCISAAIGAAPLLPLLPEAAGAAGFILGFACENGIGHSCCLTCALLAGPFEPAAAIAAARYDCDADRSCAAVSCRCTLLRRSFWALPWGMGNPLLPPGT